MVGRSQRHLREIQGVDSSGQAGAPRMREPSEVTGEAQVGKVLTGTPAEFFGSGIGVKYAWLADGVVINNQTGLTYTPVSSNIGDTIQFRTIATTADGVTTSDSEPTDPVIAA